VTDWIDVDTTLPQPDFPAVLACTWKLISPTQAVPHYFIAVFSSQANGWMDRCTGKRIEGKVTHWRSLPEPPKEGR